MSSFSSAFSAIYKAFRSLLVRDGVHVGETSGYPRVELHSWTEGAPLDKGNSVRELTVVVESMSTTSMADAVEMDSENMARLLSDAGIVSGGFEVFGIIQEQLQQINEVAEAQNTLYRLLRTYRVFVQTTNLQS